MPKPTPQEKAELRLWDFLTKSETIVKKEIYVGATSREIWEYVNRHFVAKKK